MTCHITIQYAIKRSLAPSAALLKKWAKAVLQETDATDVTIRVVGVEEMTELNTTYRQKTGPTNVLSFAYDMPDSLGDIVICAEVVDREADAQAKSREAHWAHMVVHGMYHLLGHDHELEEEAKIMETLEIETLRVLGFANPYELRDV